MESLNVRQAARHLGVTERTARNLIVRGELIAASVDPIRLDPAHVAQVLAVRQEAALLELLRLRKDAVVLARETRKHLDRPYSGVNLPEHQAEDRQRRMALVSQTAKTLFGVAALAAAQSDDGCRWCTAEQFGRVLSTWAPTAFTPALRVLFDQDPCGRCGPRLYGAVLASLAARVHRGGGGASAGRTEAPAPVVDAAPRRSVERVPVPARPVQDDDDGRALIARRRREVQARITRARRAGDSRYEAQLRLQLRALTADASAVDAKKRASS